MPDEKLSADTALADAPSEEGAFADRGLEELSAADALERLGKGQALQNCRIERLVLKGEFTLPVRFKNVYLHRPRIMGATFKEELSLVGCTVDRPHFSHRTVFERELCLSNSLFIKATVQGLEVRGQLKANNVTTRGRMLWTNCKFESDVSFWDAHGEGWIEHKRCTFAKTADFRSLHVEEGLSFEKCEFRGPCLFRGATVVKKFDLSTCSFADLLDLSKAKFQDFAYLEGIEQGPGNRLAFVNTLAERVLVRPEQIEGRLASEERKDHAQAMQEYGLFRRVFNNLHRYDQEDWAFYRFKVNQRRAKPRSWRRPWTQLQRFAEWSLLDLGCRYGVAPMQAIRFAMVLILAFAAIYAIGYDSLYIEHPPFEQRDSWLNRIAVGLLTSVAVFTSGFGGIRDLAKGWMNLPLMVESLLGTLVWGLFIVAFSRKVIR